MTLRSASTHRPYQHSGLTPLNRATSKRYDRCRGRHTPSGQTVERQFPGAMRVLPVCLRCGVPYNGPLPHNWSSGKARGPKLPGSWPTARDGEAP